MIRIIPQADLAEFFCEDPKTFRIEECFKAFHQFCSNFKTAVTENEKRREQERIAEQRRLQRENDQVLTVIIMIMIVTITIIMAVQRRLQKENDQVLIVRTINIMTIDHDQRNHNQIEEREKT